MPFFLLQLHVFGAEVGGEVLQYIPSPLSLILLFLFVLVVYDEVARAPISLIEYQLLFVFTC
jgi:hypothetical protein